MIVVADSSPLVALVSIAAIEALPRLFGVVLIPPAVLAELRSPRRSSAVQAFADRPPAWLEVHDPLCVDPIAGLHAGEQAALALALERHADLVLIDETLGRRAASQRRLRVAGTVGVLERAAEFDLLDLPSAFERLKATDFWINPAILEQRLAAFLEKQNRRGSSG